MILSFCNRHRKNLKIHFWECQKNNQRKILGSSFGVNSLVDPTQMLSYIHETLVLLHSVYSIQFKIILCIIRDIQDSFSTYILKYSK